MNRDYHCNKNIQTERVSRRVTQLASKQASKQANKQTNKQKDKHAITKRVGEKSCNAQKKMCASNFITLIDYQ
jgi:hypothetical protein